jgi:hypothetical protein
MTLGGLRTPWEADASMRLGPLVTPDEVLEPLFGETGDGYPGHEIAALRSMARYLTESLTAPHSDLGRSGAVCPFAARSLRASRLTLAATRLDRIDDDVARAIMVHMRDAFLDDANASGPDILRAIVVTFPSVPALGAAAMIERVQQALKPDFVTHGLMIGEFHPFSEAQGLHNAHFRPFRAPVPSLAIRAMTLHDAPFLWDDARHLAAFVQRFGDAGRRAVATRGQTGNSLS